MQNTTSQQILQELNNKCDDYEKEIEKIKIEKEAIQETNNKLLKQIQEFEEKTLNQNNEKTEDDNQELLALKQKLETLEKELDSNKSTIDNLNTENKKLSDINTEYESLKKVHADLENEANAMVYTSYNIF